VPLPSQFSKRYSLADWEKRNDFVPLASLISCSNSPTISAMMGASEGTAFLTSCRMAGKLSAANSAVKASAHTHPPNLNIRGSRAQPDVLMPEEFIEDCDREWNKRFAN
jgi:hypothetical protein